MHMQKVSYTMPMRNTAKFLVAGAFALAMVQIPTAPQQPQSAQAQPQTPVFGSRADLVTTDVIVRDSKNDQFVADLKPTDFDILEDGVKQELASMVLIHGGRAYNTLAPPPAPLQEGIILPVARPTNDAAGRVFLLFVDERS